MSGALPAGVVPELLQRTCSAPDTGPDGSGKVLGTVGFGAQPAPPRNGAPAVHVAVGTFAGEPPFAETWYARGATRPGRLRDVVFAGDGDTMFGHVALDESRLRGGLRATAQHAYAAIFAALDHAGALFALRFWNYVPRINGVLDGLERYRHFNIGRHDAFLAARRAAFAGAPAACALGTPGGPLSVHFLAARLAPAAIENPRQVSAYHYPAEYGPRTPTFSRAVLVEAVRPAFFVSGTASIVGFRSMHAGDPAAQTRETFANLRAVVGAARARAGGAPLRVEDLAYLVYVRHARDLPAVKAQFLAEVGPHGTAARRAHFVQADICRAELLVEIEAVGVCADRPAW
jgi:enamine deaminase RidA (YjgF/YER057c/UK114 family)